MMTMLKLDMSKRLYPLWTSLFGFAIFIVIAILINFLWGNEWQNLIVPAVASLVFGFLFISGKKVFLLALVFLIGFPLIALILFPLGYLGGLISGIAMIFLYAALGAILAITITSKKSIGMATLFRTEIIGSVL